MLEDLSYIQCRDLLESTGIKNISESSGEISFSCPSSDHFHGDTSPSARMNSRSSAFLCHSCGARGNGITFLAWHKSIPETVARRLLEERYGGGRISAGVGSLEQEVKRIMNPVIVEETPRIPPAESWLEAYHVDWRNKSWCQGCSPDPESKNEQVCSGCAQPPEYKQYVYDRNFDPEILNKWEVGYDKISERITIPIRDHEGKLVGFKGRAWRENTIPKYMILGDNRNQTRYGFQPYQKSHYIFGLYNSICNDFIGFQEKAEEEDLLNVVNNSPLVIGGKLGCIIVEGELNVIAMSQYGHGNTLGIAGSEFSQIQCDLIKGFYKRAILFLDNDKAGDKGTKKVVEMLSPYMPLKIVQNAPGDAADLDTQTVRDLIKNAQSSLVLQAQGLM